MDSLQITAIALGGLCVGSIISTQILVRFPGTRAWVQSNAIKGYNYLDSIKDEVPDCLLPQWQSAYDELDAVIDAFGDDKVTPREIRHMATHAFELVNGVRKLIQGSK